MLLAVLAAIALPSQSAGQWTPAPDVEGPSTTEPDFDDDIDTSLIGSTSGGSTLFPDSGNGGYDVSVYDLDLALSDDLTSLSGVATITASATQDLQRFSLDARELDIASVTVDGTPAEYTLTSPELVITAPQPFLAGSDFVVEVAYVAEPELYQPAGVPFEMGWDVDPDEQVFVHGFPGAAATWTPVNEDLDEPPVRFIMRFDVPEGFTATASGIPTENDDGSAGVVWDTGIAVFGGHVRSGGVRIERARLERAGRSVARPGVTASGAARTDDPRVPRLRRVVVRAVPVRTARNLRDQRS